MSEITVCGFTVKSGERYRGLLPVTTLASGLELSIPVHILNGKKPGPRLMLTALSHGDATTGFEVIRRVLNNVDVEALSGAIIAIPCQNPIAFEWGTRGTPTDMYNMLDSGEYGIRAAFYGLDWPSVRESLAPAVDVMIEEFNASLDDVQ